MEKLSCFFLSFPAEVSLNIDTVKTAIVLQFVPLFWGGGGIFFIGWGSVLLQWGLRLPSADVSSGCCGSRFLLRFVLLSEEFRRLSVCGTHLYLLGQPDLMHFVRNSFVLFHSWSDGLEFHVSISTILSGVSYWDDISKPIMKAVYIYLQMTGDGEKSTGSTGAPSASRKFSVGIRFQPKKIPGLWLHESFTFEKSGKNETRRWLCQWPNVPKTGSTSLGAFNFVSWSLSRTEAYFGDSSPHSKKRKNPMCWFVNPKRPLTGQRHWMQAEEHPSSIHPSEC